MIQRIVLEPAEERISPAPKVLVLTQVADVVFVSIEVEDETNKTRTNRVIEDKEAKEEGESDMPMKAELAVDAGDLKEAVLLLKHRTERLEERMKAEKLNETRRKIDQPMRDLQSAVEKANYRAETLHKQYVAERDKGEELARHVEQLQAALDGLKKGEEASPEPAEVPGAEVSS